MQEYRTQEQFYTICDSLTNGNYSEAIDYAVEYGFSAVDISKYVNDQELITNSYLDATHFFYLCEGIGRVKGQEDIKSLADVFKTETIISG